MTIQKLEKLNEYYTNIHSASGDLFELLNDAHELAIDVQDDLNVPDNIKNTNESLFLGMVHSSLHIKGAIMSLKIRTRMTRENAIRSSLN